MTQDAKKFFHWKKNLDSKFIAGEDLQGELNGLKAEMVVVIEHFGENKTFDANANKDKIVTDLYLREVGTNKKLYKPAVLNKTNARFFATEFASNNVYDWLEKPVSIYAQADRRHGYVVRFKQAPASAKFDNKESIAKLKSSTSLDTLKSNWESLSEDAKRDTDVKRIKDELKTRFDLVPLYMAKKDKLGTSDQRNYMRILDEHEVESYEKMKKELEAITLEKK